MKKIITPVLNFCLLLQFSGCYTPQLISKEELLSKPTGTGLVVQTNDQVEYFFSRGSYTITNDSLFGQGSLILENGAKVNLDSTTVISLNEVENFKVEKIDAAGTIVLGVIAVGLVVLIAMGINSLMEDTTQGIAEGIGRGLSGVFK